MPVRATDSHDYAKDEYAIIRDGLSPDKQKSLASHGDGDGGRENFHVWLMAEPAHRRIAPLADIPGRLDTGPGAYYAFWSADSRSVAVTFRSDRHIVELNLYRIEGRRAQAIRGPTPVPGSHQPRSRATMTTCASSIPEFEWKGPARFVIEERRLFQTSDPGFVRMMGAYGKIGDKAAEGQFFVEFSAEADCVLMPGQPLLRRRSQGRQVRRVTPSSRGRHFRRVRRFDLFLRESYKPRSRSLPPVRIPPMSVLFSPIKLRGLALPNRIMVAPMCQYSAENGEANDWHFTHINTLALSGAAMVCIEATAVEADRPHHAGLPRAVERRHRSGAAADPGVGAQAFEDRP